MNLTTGTRYKIQGARKGLLLACILYLVPCTCLSVTADEFPALRLFMDEMASKYEFDHDELASWFAEVRIREDILEAIRRPREDLPWHEYRKQFVNEERAGKGLVFWKKNADILFRAQGEFGVPAEIIVAIIGVETRYGTQNGRYRVLEALATLALTARRVAGERGGELSAAAFRDATGLGRKRAIQVLEYFDRIGLLRRVGDVHKLRADSTLFLDAREAA